MYIKDSGENRSFSTGAIRDANAGKGRCDLLPVLDIGESLELYPLINIGRYLESGEPSWLGAAAFAFFEDDVEGADRYEILLELAKYYEKGFEKYKDGPWTKGLPLSSFIDSGVRHYLKHMAGMKDEPHDLAFLWNIYGAMWTHRNLPEMIDVNYPPLSL